MAEEAEEKINDDIKSEETAEPNNTSEPGPKEQQKYKQEAYHNPKCNLRIEELSKPRKILVQAMYNEYKDVLPKLNAVLVKQYLDEEYAKNTQDIVDYFTKIKSAHDDKRNKKLSKQKAKRKDKENSTRQKRQEMINILKELMKKTLFNAYMNPKQIIMTGIMRKISDRILSELCKLRRIEVPDREDPSIRADLLCTLSDWLAFCVDSVYYEVQVRKVHDYDELLKQMQDENNANAMQ